MPIVHLKVDASLSLTAPDGSAVPVTDVEADLDIADGALHGVEITFTLAPDQWARVDAGGWFHMPPEVRGPTFANGFEPGAPLFVTARLNAPVLAALAAVEGDKWDWTAELAEPEEVPALAQTESWTGLAVLQQRGPVKGGFSTKASGRV